jgi:hypothetical protein
MGAWREALTCLRFVGVLVCSVEAEGVRQGVIVAVNATEAGSSVCRSRPTPRGPGGGAGGGGQLQGRIRGMR